MDRVQPCLGLKKQQQQHASRGINSFPKKPQEGLRVLHLVSVFLGDVVLTARWLTAPAFWVILDSSLSSEGHAVSCPLVFFWRNLCIYIS